MWSVATRRTEQPQNRARPRHLEITFQKHSRLEDLQLINPGLDEENRRHSSEQMHTNQ